MGAIAEIAILDIVLVDAGALDRMLDPWSMIFLSLRSMGDRRGRLFPRATSRPCSGTPLLSTAPNTAKTADLRRKITGIAPREIHSCRPRRTV
jgi:hypothetical protein